MVHFQMSFSLILPTLNERGHIISLIEEIKKIFIISKKKYEIIVVDDNSTDGTIETLKNYAKDKKNIKLIVRKERKKNLADSLNKGIQNSKNSNLIWMDADFQHPPKYILKFIKKIDKCDAIICSRFLKDSKRYFHQTSFKKNINENQSYIFNKLSNYFLFKDITDYTSGYICLKKSLLKNYKLKGYYGDYFLNLICFLKKKNKKIIEIPFSDSLRASGKSKTVVNLNLPYIYTCLRYFLTFLKSIILFRL